MSRIFCIANQKGGVGKTTTTVNLAAGLARLGRRVLLVDLDPQGNATMGSGVDKRSLESSVYDVLLESTSVAEARRPSPKGGYDVVGANRELAGAEIELVGLERRNKRLQAALAAVDGEYDMILIDCGERRLQALVAAFEADQLDLGAGELAIGAEDVVAAVRAGPPRLGDRRAFEQDVVHARLEGALVDARAHGRVALRIEIDQQNAPAEVGQTGGEIDRGRRLADAALLVRDTEDLAHAKPVAFDIVDVSMYSLL